MSSRVIEGPQGRLAIQVDGGGGGLPVVFLHADAGRAAQWQEIMAHLAPSRMVAALDFRGHGASAPARDADYGFAARSDDLAAMVDALALPRFAIVAHSGGCAVALAYAAEHADRVAGILMVDPPTDPRALPAAQRDEMVADAAGPAGLEVLRGFYRTIAGPNKGTQDRILADVEAVDPSARAGIVKALAEWNPDATLRAFTGPMLVLATPPNDTPAALFRLRPDIPHRIVAESGHWLQLDQPRIVEDAITTFLAQLDAHGEA